MRPRSASTPAVPVGLVVVLLALPALAGCTQTGNGNGPPPTPGVCGHLSCQAYFAPGLDLRVDHPYGFVQANGTAVVYTYFVNGTELGAVLLGATWAWKADEVFQIVQRENLPLDEFLLPPSGEWPKLKDRLHLVPAGSDQVAAEGLASGASAAARASKLLPPNETLPSEGRWFMNGTVVLDARPYNLTIATQAGPMVFNRQADKMIAVQGQTVVSWSDNNLTLDIEQDGIARMSLETRDAVPHLQVSWDLQRVDAFLGAPPFRKADLNTTDTPSTRLAAVRLPGIASLVMVKYDYSPIFDDGLVELRTQNITMRMATQ